MLHLHYRGFITATSSSVPVHGIGTQPLVVVATWESPLTSARLVREFHRRARFMLPLRRTTPAQHSEFTCRIIPEVLEASGFDVKRVFYDASTVVRVYPSLRTTPRSSLTFPHRSRPPLLMTTSLKPTHDSRLRRTYHHILHSFQVLQDSIR